MIEMTWCNQSLSSSSLLITSLCWWHQSSPLPRALSQHVFFCFVFYYHSISDWISDRIRVRCTVHSTPTSELSFMWDLHKNLVSSVLNLDGWTFFVCFFSPPLCCRFTCTCVTTAPQTNKGTSSGFSSSSRSTPLTLGSAFCSSPTRSTTCTSTRSETAMKVSE